MHERPLTPERLAERWECSPHHIRNLCRRGKLPHFRIGKEYCIPLPVVEGVEACDGREARPAEEGPPAARPFAAPKIVAPPRR